MPHTLIHSFIHLFISSLICLFIHLPIGYDTNNCNNIRLWSSKPKRQFDLKHFNEGEYEKAVQEQKQAENITAVLYPNDNHMVGKELRLKQQYFWVAASLHDM